MYNIEDINLPKYVPQLLNLANQNAQATRPRHVGQLSNLFPEFINTNKSATVQEWEKWYNEMYPKAINEASIKIFNQIKNLKKAIDLIDEDMVRLWVHDLIINKTYTGLAFQQAIIRKIAESKGQSWRLASPEEESLGIDGYIGSMPVSVKPKTYKTMDRLSEQIDVNIIYYQKKKDQIVIEFEE